MSVTECGGQTEVRFLSRFTKNNLYVNIKFIFRLIIKLKVQCVCFIRLHFFMMFALFTEHHLGGSPTQMRAKRDRILHSSENRRDRLIGRRCPGKRSQSDFTETGRGWVSRVRRHIRTTCAAILRGERKA